MLEAIRKHVGSLVVKVLFVVLVLSFVVWGVADVFRPGAGSDWAAKVGGERISTAVFQEEYRDTLHRLAGATGSPVDPEQARAMGLPGSVLKRMIDGALIDRAAADLGVTVGDTQVREAIRDDPLFRNQQGAFDAEVFRAVLSRNGFSEERYVDLLRRELQRRQLVASLAGGVLPPRPLVDALERYRGERRTAEYVTLADADAGPLPVPDEPVLRQFHQDYPGLFTAPEYRAATAVVIGADDIATGLAVDESELQAAYQERAAEFTRPERRSFRQVLVADEATARAIRERAGQGAELAAAASAAGVAAGDVATLGPVAREQLPPELAAAVFALLPRQPGEPVKSPLGWHVIEVTAIEPGAVQSYAEVRERLAAELKRERAVDQLVDLGNRLEDALGRGATLPEAAGELGLPVHRLDAVDSGGRDPEGKPIDGLPAQLVETIFETQQGADSPLVEADRDTYFVVHVDAVTPAAVKPFEQVHAQVAEAWRARARTDRTKLAGDELAERVRGGAGLAAAAAEKHLKPVATPPFTRDGAGAPGLSRVMVGALFEAKPGETVVVPVDDGYAVARLAAVLPPADQAGAGSAAVRAELTEAMRGDILAQLASALRDRYPVSVNPRALDQL